MSTKQIFKNAAHSTLSGTLAIGGLTINLAAGGGAKFPTPSAGEYVYVSLYEKDAGAVEITPEIVKVTSITADSLTVVRDIEGLVVAAGGTSGGWAYPSAIGVNPSQVVYVALRYTAFAANNTLFKDGNLAGLDSASTARTNLGLGSIATQDSDNVTITGGTITGVTMTDSSTVFADEADSTKKMQFQLSSIGTGLTRTITVPNTDITLPGVNVVNTWAAIQTFTLQPIMTSLTASCAVATDGSKGLVSVANTGTGSNVLATSPQITTSITTDSTTFAIANATATTINAFGAATTIAIGAATGTLTVSNTTLAAKAGTFSTTLAVTGHTTFEGVTSTGATGTGKIVYDGTPTLVTPVLGVATATSINKVAITAPASSATLTIADGKTLTVSNNITLAGTDGKTLTISKSLTLDGTDGTTMTFPATSATIARTDAANAFTGVQSMTSPDITTSLTTPSVTFSIANATATTLNIGGAATTIAIGASTGTLTVSNTTLAAKAGTFSTTLAVTGHTTFEGVTSTGATGTGKIVYDGTPTLVTPVLGVATATSINKVTVTAPATSATLTIADGASLITAGAYAVTLTATGATGVTLPTTGTLSAIAGTETLTNKRITARVGSTTSSATPTINTDNVDIYKLTAQTADITSFTTNLSGTPTDGQVLIIEITGTAARAITWGTSFEASTVALPTTTVTTALLAVGFLYNGVTSKWRCVASC